MPRKPSSEPSAPEGFGSLRGVFERVLRDVELPEQPKQELPKQEESSSPMAPEYYVGQTGSPVPSGTLRDDGSGANGEPNGDSDEEVWREAMFGDSLEIPGQTSVFGTSLRDVHIGYYDEIDLRPKKGKDPYPEGWHESVECKIRDMIRDKQGYKNPKKRHIKIIVGKGKDDLRSYVLNFLYTLKCSERLIEDFANDRDGAFVVRVRCDSSSGRY